ncbi:hypothetical protein [Bordetella sp. N]|uniref:hypothetical protein n=1 Tax=Bordetella sp. N TaxID=1746199 RepID=UPI00070D6F3B|nr:hypothetical protein [Bordetella sp. N]ALM86231.1 hypothetical protein ASB57_27715 [Bordetella sp. N]
MMARMIPVALPSAAFFFLMAASFCALAGLACWLGMLAISKGWRRALRGAPVKHGVGLLLVVLLSAPAVAYLYVIRSIDQEHAKEAAARRMTLSDTTRIGALDMPEGTRLTLRRAGEPETFTLAEFPRPVAVGEVQATRVRRELTDEYDSKTYAAKATYPTALAATGAGVQQVDGWRCDAARGVTFDTARDGTLTRLAHCALAQGNTVATPGRGDGHIDLPAGTDLRASSGNRYVDGFTDADRWEVQPPEGTVLQVAGLALLDPLIRLDADRRYFELPTATLACDLVLGEMHYATGTKVRSAPRNWRGKHPDVWVFSPWDGQPARRDGHADVGGKQSVVQAPDGTVLAVVDSESVGVFR